MRLNIFRSILLIITSTLLVISCSVPNPQPNPTPRPKREPNPTSKKESYSREEKTEKKLRFFIPKPTDQIHIFEIKLKDINGNPVQNVELEADIELLGSIENEHLINSQTINYETDSSGFVHFKIKHPITQTQSGFSTYTLVNFAAFKDGYIDLSGSFDLQHNEKTLTKDYKTNKHISKTITLLKPDDFINNAFELYSVEANIDYDDLENCIETFALFPATYGQLKTGSVTLVKYRNELFLEFGFNSAGNEEWLLETFKSIGRRIGSSLFESNIDGIRLRVNQTTTYSTSTDSLSKYLDREYSDSKFLRKIKKG